MKRNQPFVFRLSAGFLLVVLILSSCTFPTANQFVDQNLSITQTFSAVDASIAQTQAAAGEEVPLVDPVEPVPEESESELPTETPEPTATIEHKVIPGEAPAGNQSSMTDPSSANTAGELRTNAGEYFAQNLYERPFNGDPMDTYFPDLDINRAVLNKSGNWYYETIQLTGTSPEGDMRGYYGLEIDLDLDGRGDVLILGGQPGNDWSTDNVRVWQDTNNDVGDNMILASDPPQSGNGYDKLVFDAGIGDDPDLAWVRRSPSDQNSVQLAFKPSAINSDAEFIWGAWTDLGVTKAEWYDYNDHFTADEAGSPLAELSQYYPLKALAQVDNTCRWSYGFTLEGDEPGICAIPKTATPTITPSPTPNPSSLTGIVYRDGAGELTYNPGETPISGANVHLYSGSCGSGGGEISSTTSGSDGRYSFGGLTPGSYCVDVVPAAATYTAKTNATTITVGEPKTHTVNFGYFYLG
ncbi:MAG: carboxypeptidase regulatory-like domain-containing protein [Anaerolineaceae bacterium]|nr:carboxypeptidase regulatory-like domain-containing protein [Anaerolineaceae bacterium]